MADNGFELPVAEAKGSLAPKPQAQQLVRTPHDPPEAASALEKLRATNGFASALERLPGLGQVQNWVQVAYYSVCNTTGAAASDGTYLFGASFPGFSLTMQDSVDNCLAYFVGAAEPFLDVVSLGVVLGYIVCPLEVTTGGNYLFHLQLARYSNPYDPQSATRESTIEICIDNETVAIIHPAADQQSTFPVIANLGAGRHVFQIVQEGTAGFFFENVTVWQLPFQTGNPLP